MIDFYIVTILQMKNRFGNKKYHIGRIYEKYWGKDRPKNVEKQIKKYWETDDEEKRKIIYQYIELERLIAEGIKLT